MQFLLTCALFYQKSLHLEEVKIQLNQFLKHPITVGIYNAYRFIRIIFAYLIAGLFSVVSTCCSLAKNLVQFAYFSSDSLLFVAQLILELLRRLTAHLLYEETIPFLLRPIAWLIKLIFFFYFQASWLRILFVCLNFAFKVTLRFFSIFKNLVNLV